MGVQYMLVSNTYRQSVLKEVRDPVLRDFWYEFEKLPPKGAQGRNAQHAQQDWLLANGPTYQTFNRTPAFVLYHA